VVPEIIIPKADIADNIDDTDTAHRRYSIQYDMLILMVEIVDIDDTNTINHRPRPILRF